MTRLPIPKEFMRPSSSPSPEELQRALEIETQMFGQAYSWLEKHMPKSFAEAVDQEIKILIARQLMSFCVQDRFAPIYFRHKIIVLCQDGPDADLRIFKKFRHYVIRYYRTFVSNAPAPCDPEGGGVRIAFLYFYDLSKTEALSEEKKQEIYAQLKQFHPQLSDEEMASLIRGITPNFLRSMAGERLSSALSMLLQARHREQCQLEAKRNEQWVEKEAPSLQLVLAWRNVPKAGFLYHLAKIISTHHLALKKVVGTYIDLSNTETILLLSLGLHGKHGKAAWEEADLEDFFRELTLIKYFETDDKIGLCFTESKLLSGNEAHLVRNFASFIHQVLVYGDPHLYSYENVIEGLCRHPELTVLLCKFFQQKFDPQKIDTAQAELFRSQFLQQLEKLDTGQPLNDIRRKNILKQGLHFIDHILKTNFYLANKSSFAFRLHPSYLDLVPYDRKDKFPELPYGIFFIRGMHFLGFHIRFKDLARGGVRTVIPERMEQYHQERNTIFSEAYHLAYTQQKKNKDIPEGGAKTAILLEPFEVFAEEEEIYRKELKADGIDPEIWEEKLKIYHREHKLDYLYASQSSFIDSLLTLINCEENGRLRTLGIVDYWKRPEYIYLGPDENMSNDMIIWISNYATTQNYAIGRAFMSSKPGAGINHKEFGVTSFGLNVYLEEILKFLGIDPKKDLFTIKISGGPDGDVAGNEIVNLYKFYPHTARLLALTDVSGTIYDPQGLDLKEMVLLFQKSLPIRNYPPEKLNEGGFLLDVTIKREESPLSKQTLLWRKINQTLVQEWISGNEMNQLYRNHLHQVVADVFIPAGGRPRTLNETNWQTFLDETGKPTAKAIVEGANLYLTPAARRALEKLGVFIFKDSSCNKGGVICSSFEVLANLILTEEEFLKEKSAYVEEVLARIGQVALQEARLLLETHRKTGRYLTEISEEISERINLYKYQLFNYLEKMTPIDPVLLSCVVKYCPPLLQKRYEERIFSLPLIHQKAIISSYLASHLVYQKGLDWTPSIIDFLPLLAKNLNL